MHTGQSAFNAYTQSFWFKQSFAGFIFALLMWAVYPYLQLDTYLTGWFFDAHQQRFPLKHQPFLAQWMHVGLKWLMVSIAVACLALSILGNQFFQLKAHRKSWLWVFVGMVLSTTVVAVLKHYSQHACPWDLAMYGGDQPFLELFTSGLPGVEAGRCFPAGHPSGGFALMAFYFAFIHSKPRFATYMLWLGLAVGLVMGMVQVARGAHFLSHVLWSGWVVWVTLRMLHAVWSPEKQIKKRNLEYAK